VRWSQQAQEVAERWPILTEMARFSDSDQEKLIETIVQSMKGFQIAPQTAKQLNSGERMRDTRFGNERDLPSRFVSRIFASGFLLSASLPRHFSAGAPCLRESDGNRLFAARHLFP